MQGYISEVLKIMVNKGCSDLHLSAGLPPVFRKDGFLLKLEEIEDMKHVQALKAEDTKRIVQRMISNNKWLELEEEGELDFSYYIKEIGRFRVSAFKEHGNLGLAIRSIARDVPSFDNLNLPKVMKELIYKPNGIILVTGPAGSGKSTTLASLIDLVNREKKIHIITLEDPIEYLHKPMNCIINQREVGTDTKSFQKALRASLRQDPDIIMLGEMRDLETIETALRAAETGHLVLTSLHTNSAVKTIDRIIDVFPGEKQQQVRVQLASVLQGVISQRLLPMINGGRIPVCEVLLASHAVSNLIREGKSHQIYSILQTSKKEGMITLEQSITQVCREGKISKATAAKYMSLAGISSLDYEVV